MGVGNAVETGAGEGVAGGGVFPPHAARKIVSMKIGIRFILQL